MSEARDDGDARAAAPSKPRRRYWLFVAAVLASLPILAWRVSACSDVVLPLAGADVKAYFGDLHDGSTIDGATIVRIYDIRSGAIPVVLATPSGVRFQVDLLRRATAETKVPAQTDALSLYVTFSGDAAPESTEPQMKATEALAGALRKRETDGAKPPRLATFDERAAANPNPRFSVPLD